MRRFVRSLVIAMLASVSAHWAAGADPATVATQPIGWRGDGSGRYLAAKPLAKWSAKGDILWRAEVGSGASSPMVVGSRLFITSEPDLLICLDSESGKEMWRKTHKAADVPAAAAANATFDTNPNGDATPTPVSDGKWVWAVFGTGVVACYDLEGRTRWINWFDLPPSTQYGRTASPLLVGGRLLVHLGPLVCLDAATGEVLWTNEAAKANYGTPVATRIGDVDVVITPKGHALRLSDGKILTEDLGHCMYTSPVVQDGVVYFIDSSSSAVRLPERAGEMFVGKELWYQDLTGEFFASPIVYDGRLYAVDRSANCFVLDAATGKTISKKALELPPAGASESPNIYPSLCLAGKHVFVGNDAGESLFIEPGAIGQAITGGPNALPEGSAATPVFIGQRMFIRGGDFVYCVGRAAVPEQGH